MFFRTRQITGSVTLMPGSPALIQAVYFESPKCPSGTGDFMAAKITEVADKWIEPDQYQGSVGDGVYRHCSVPQKLDEQLSSLCNAPRMEHSVDWAGKPRDVSNLVAYPGSVTLASSSAIS